MQSADEYGSLICLNYWFCVFCSFRSCTECCAYWHHRWWQELQTDAQTHDSQDVRHWWASSSPQSMSHLHRACLTFIDYVLYSYSMPHLHSFFTAFTVLGHCCFGHLACKNRPRYDLLCVEWDVKPYTLTHSLLHSVILPLYLGAVFKIRMLRSE